MLLKPKFNYFSLERDETTGVRLYRCPDGGDVPSVTTILSATQSEEKKAILDEWRTNVGETKAKNITTEAANRGTRMHAYLEEYIKNGFLRESGSNPYSKQAHKMAKTIIDKGLYHVSEFWGYEVPLYYPEIYAGTTDCLGIHNDEPAILDYKQSNKVKTRDMITDYLIQLCLYATAHNKLYDTNIRKGVILMAVAPPVIENNQWGDVEYLEFILEGQDWDNHVVKMWDRIEQYYTKGI